jgi:hypothetical protein
MSLLPIMNNQKWETLSFTHKKVMLLSDQEKNAGLSQLQDLLKSMPRNSRLMKLRCKKDFGETIILILKLKHGELNQLQQVEKL